MKNYAPNAEDTKASAQLYEQWIELTAQSEKFGRSLKTDLSPEMHELMSFISDAVDKRADRWLANIKYETDQFGRALKQIDWRGIGNDLKAWEEYLKSIDWHSVSENVKQFASGADTAAKAVGGWKDVVGALFDLWVSAKFFQVLGNVRMLAAASSATSSGSIAGASALLGAGMFATQAGYEAYKEIKYDASDEGRLANRRDIFARKDPYYSGNRYSALEQNQIQHALFGYGVGTLHRDPKDVAAMLAMFKAESGFNTEAIGDNGDAVGLAQWHYERQKWIEQMAGKRLSAMTPQEQMKWAFAERDERYKGVSSQVAKDSTAAQMAAHLTAGYEIPKDVDGESVKRGILANRIYANETGSTGSAFTDVLASLRASQAAMHTASSTINNQGGDTSITVPVSVSVTAPPGSNPHATGRAVADAIHDKFSSPQLLARMASRGVQ